MDDAELRATVVTLLRKIAPELDPATLDGAAALREQVDLDSMDFLNFLVAIEQRLQVSIPEADYEQLRSLDDLVRYLGARRPAP
jgi:acyl carrier protein